MNEYDVFLVGKEVTLVAITEDVIHNTNYYKWFNDEKVMEHLEHHLFPNTKAKQLQYLEQELTSNSKCQLGMVDNETNTFFGIISLSKIDYFNKKCMISIIIGEEKYRSLKKFTEVNEMMLKHAFNAFGMNKVYISTLSQDVANIYKRLFKFKDEATLRQEIFKNGSYRDVIICGLLKDEYQKGSE